MSDHDRRRTERRTVFVLAGLILVAVISIAFYNLHQHPAFLAPTDELIADIDDREPNLIAATDPVALAALEQHHTDLQATVVPLMQWPPETSLFRFGSIPTAFDDAELELLTSESVWSLWAPPDAMRTPAFATARVDVESQDGQVRTCHREADGARQCGDAGWTRVRPREITIDGDASRCIWAHPLDGETLRIHYPEATPIDTDGRRLIVETGLRDEVVDNNMDVDVRIRAGDRTTTHRHRDRRGWQSVDVPAVDGTIPLTIEITADDVGRRHFCYRLIRP